MPPQKLKSLQLLVVSKTKDLFGVLEVEVLLNSKLYIYPISSEFALRKIESLIYRHKPGKALKLLNLFCIRGESNTYEKAAQRLRD